MCKHVRFKQAKALALLLDLVVDHLKAAIMPPEEARTPWRLRLKPISHLSCDIGPLFRESSVGLPRYGMVFGQAGDHKQTPTTHSIGSQKSTALEFYGDTERVTRCVVEMTLDIGPDQANCGLSYCSKRSEYSYIWQLSCSIGVIGSPRSLYSRLPADPGV